MKYGKLCIAVPLTASIFLAGCDSDRLTQFGNFAAAGTAYVATFQALTKQAGSAFIAADSATLIAARRIAVPTGPLVGQTRVGISNDDKQLQQYLTNMQTLDTHAALLGSYFAVMTELTNGKAAAQTVKAMDTLVDSIDNLAPQVAAIKIGNETVKDVAGKTTGLAIAHFEVRTLDRHLFVSAQKIDHALGLQQAAIGIIGDQLKASLGASAEAEESAKVLNPYLGPGPLPPSWAADREAYLRKTQMIASVDTAQAAIKALRTDFQTLVQDPQAKIDWKTVLDDIGKMAGYVAAAQATNSSNS